MRSLFKISLAAAAAPLAAQSPSPAANPAPFEAARGASLTPGQWSYARTVEGSEARFAMQFSIRCIAASRLVVLRRLDAATATGLTITTDLQSRGVSPSGTLGSGDALLDAIAFSRGRFLVSGGGAQRLVLPASPEAARSIEDCRG